MSSEKNFRTQHLPERRRGRQGTARGNESISATVTRAETARLWPHNQKIAGSKSSKYFQCSTVNFKWKQLERRGRENANTIFISHPLSFLSHSGYFSFFNVFLLLWRALGDGWVDGSGRCYASAPNIAQSFAYFPCLLSQTTAIIQSPTNNLFLCFFVAFLLSAVGGFSALFFQLLPWETGKVKQLMSCHLVNSRLAPTCSQAATSTAHTRIHSQTVSFCFFYTQTHTQL